MGLEIRAERCGEGMMRSTAQTSAPETMRVELYNLHISAPFTIAKSHRVGDLVHIESIIVHDQNQRLVYSGPLVKDKVFDDGFIGSLGRCAPVQPPYDQYLQFTRLKKVTICIRGPDYHQGVLTIDGVVAYSMKQAQ
ncbi:MAG: hypothetical protein Q7R76_03735 [Candidatus Woesearchaeota archaeon]|nr:hypothetical protein [Candidatus Woesearchaeota archaeon]